MNVISDCRIGSACAPLSPISEWKETTALNVWGGGQLMAFSALDGPTDFQDGICLRTTFQGTGFETLHPGRCRFDIHDAPPLRCQIGGDFFEVETPAGRTRGALLDAHHLLVEGPLSPVAEVPEIAFLRQGTRALIGVRKHFNAALIDADLDAAMAARRHWLESQHIPLPSTPDARRTAIKALSIMKTQVCTGEGLIRRRWTMPDRWPHRGMWLWDSAFHAIGWRHVDIGLAREMLEAVFDGQQPDGMVPLKSSPTGVAKNWTQPPVLALAAWMLHRTSPDREWLGRLYGPMCRYIEWDIAHRDSDGAGLMEWFIEENLNCRSGESGMDNSSRFDCAEALDATDFNSYVALECELLASIARELGRKAEARRWADRRATLCALINRRLWDEERGFYFDCRAATGERTDVMAVSGFLPLICGAPDRRQAERLAAHLDNPATFGSPLPVATIAPPSSPHYSKDMWRGPVWINLNWMVAMGMARYGFHEQASKIRERTLREIEKWYAAGGALYEYYDDQCQAPPLQLMRKGGCDVEVLCRHVVPDYGWTTTLYLDMLLEPDFARKTP